MWKDWKSVNLNQDLHLVFEEQNIVSVSQPGVHNLPETTS